MDSEVVQFPEPDDSAPYDQGPRRGPIALLDWVEVHWVPVTAALAVVALVATLGAFGYAKAAQSDRRVKALRASEASLTHTKGDLAESKAEVVRVRRDLDTARNEVEDLSAQASAAESRASLSEASAQACRTSTLKADDLITLAGQALDLSSQATTAIVDVNVSEMQRITADMKALTPQIAAARDAYSSALGDCTSKSVTESTGA